MERPDFRKRLGRIAVLFCLAVLLAGCSGSESAMPPPPAAGGYAATIPRSRTPPGTGTEPKPEPEPEPEPEIIGDALALVYEVWNLRSVSVQCQGKPGTLIVIQTHAENQTAHKAQLSTRWQSLARSRPAMQRTAWTRTGCLRVKPKTRWVHGSKQTRMSASGGRSWRQSMPRQWRSGRARKKWFTGMFSSRRKTAHGLKCTGAVGKNSAADSAQFHIKPPEKAFVLPSGSARPGILVAFPRKGRSFCRNRPQSLTKRDGFCILGVRRWYNFPVRINAGHCGPEKDGK